MQHHIMSSGAIVLVLSIALIFEEPFLRKTIGQHVLGQVFGQEDYTSWQVHDCSFPKKLLVGLLDIAWTKKMAPTTGVGQGFQ